MADTRHDVAQFQRVWNGYNKLRGLHYRPLKVDGVKGKHTRTFVQLARYYIGAGTEDWRKNTSDISPHMVQVLEHPYSRPRWEGRLVNRRRRRLATKRCDARVARWKQSRRPPAPKGLAVVDGKLCAGWIVPWLLKARRAGWRGVVVSGFRDPKYSESLCYRMCGAPQCPGRCAGRASNHSGMWYPHGAVDVTDYFTFGTVARRIGAPLHNALPYDRVHYSATGR